tara:strand:- start:16517 stop:18985 length:2469 start_codon:yes stop_codon:yes gene_type:complete
MPKKLINVSNFSGGLNKNTNSRDMIADEYQVMLNLNNEIPGKLTTYGKVVADAKNETDGTAITSINHGNGLIHFNLDRDITAPTQVNNREYLAINDIVNSKAKVIDYTSTTSSDTDIVKDITYATSGAHELVMYMADGSLRVVPKPLQTYDSNTAGTPKVLFFQEQNITFGDESPTEINKVYNAYEVQDLFIGGLTGTTDKSNRLDPEKLYKAYQTFKPLWNSEIWFSMSLTAGNITEGLPSTTDRSRWSYTEAFMQAAFSSIPYSGYGPSPGGIRGSFSLIAYFGQRETATDEDEDSSITVYKSLSNKRYGLWAAPLYEKNKYEAPAYFMSDIPQQAVMTADKKRFLYFGMYGRPPVTNTRISGYKIYWGLINNFGTPGDGVIHDGSVENKYLFAEIDFTKGIRYAGKSEYAAFTEKLTSTDGGNFYNWIYPKTGYANPSYFVGKEISELSIQEPYIQKSLSVIGPPGTGFNTATIANRKSYIGNVKYYTSEDELVTKNDRILKSLPNQFDYFEEDGFIDVEVEDGDDIIKLASLGQKLLEFKKRVLYIINVSRNIEYLEGTYAFKGCEKDYHVYEGEGFITWFNRNGIFFYDGQQLTDIALNESGQSIFSDNSYFDLDNVIGYLPKTKEIFIANKNNTILKYDLKSQSWTEGDFFGTVNSSNFTNFILKNDESLSYYQLIQGLNGAADKIELRNWNPTPVSFTGSNKTILKTKEFDFGNPTANKNINTIYVNYKNGQNITVKGFGTKRDASAVALADIGVDASSSLLIDTSGGFRTTKIAVNSTFKDLVSFGIALELDGASATDFELNDLQVVYRDKVFR